uniref:Uncharacterized protein n=1 Tax=Arundo donax TaxID=35708 RepID=A0A0A8ZRN7_ARUDO
MCPHHHQNQHFSGSISPPHYCHSVCCNLRPMIEAPHLAAHRRCGHSNQKGPYGHHCQ